MASGKRYARQADEGSMPPSLDEVADGYDHEHDDHHENDGGYDHGHDEHHGEYDDGYGHGHDEHHDGYDNGYGHGHGDHHDGYDYNSANTIAATVVLIAPAFMNL